MRTRDTWIVSACAALLVIGVAAFMIDRVDSSARNAAEHLGYAGASMRITVIHDDAAPEHEGFSERFAHYVTAEGLSVAYTQWYESGIVTVTDPEGRFRTSTGALTRHTGPSGIAVSDTVDEGSARAIYAAFGNTEVAVPTFSIDVMFETRYPVVLADPSAVPFDTGVYLIASDDIDTRAVTHLFEDGGYLIVDATVQPGFSLATTTRQALSSVYGVVTMFFWLVLATCLLLATKMRVALRHRAYLVSGVLGAARRDVRRLVWSDVGPAHLVGLLGGAALVGMATWATAPYTVAPVGERIGAVLAALTLSAVMSLGSISWAAAAEARRVERENAP